MITVRGICTGGPPDEWAAEPKNKAAAELGKRGGEARAKNMTKKERSEAARSGGALNCRPLELDMERRAL
jgi:general stress protein YciG